MLKHIAILVPAVAKSFHANAMTNTTKKTVTKRRTPACNSVYVAIAGEVVNRRSVLLKNFVPNGQESTSNPLLHIHAKRYGAFKKNDIEYDNHK